MTTLLIPPVLVLIVAFVMVVYGVAEESVRS